MSTNIPEFQVILNEASKQAEDLLALEDKGWNVFGTRSAASGGVTEQERQVTVAAARVHQANDPLATQAVRLWTSYTLGTGMTFNVDEEFQQTADILQAYWGDPLNRGVLSPKGQRKSSDRVLTDGELFFAVFFDNAKKTARIRRITTLEITEIISNPDDAEDVLYYKREWIDAENQRQTAIYRSSTNVEDKGVRLSNGRTIKASENTNGAVVFHFAFNTIGVRGNSLLTAAIPWIKLHRKFLASRAAIMLALARFAWKGKVKGGQGAVNKMRNLLHDKLPEAGAVEYENDGFDLSPINANSNARNAMNDDRMLKLQVFSAVGWPEQYFGDISTGNLATAKTVELPVQKMVQTYQQDWAGMYDEIDRYVLFRNDVPEDQMRVDRDFPAISPEDAGTLAESINKMVESFPDFADNRDVMQQALEAIGVNDTQVVLDDIFENAEDEDDDPAVTESRRLRRLMRAMDVIETTMEGIEDGNNPGTGHSNGRENNGDPVRAL